MKIIRYFNLFTTISVIIALLTLANHYWPCKYNPFTDWTAFAGFGAISAAIYVVQNLDARRVVKIIQNNPSIDIVPLFQYLKKLDYDLYIECVVQYNEHLNKSLTGRLMLLKTLSNTQTCPKEIKDSIEKIIEEIGMKYQYDDWLNILKEAGLNNK